MKGLRLAASALVVALGVVVCANTSASPRSRADRTFDCPSVEPVSSVDPDDPLVMDAGQLAQQMHVSLSEAVAILGMQERIGLLGEALDRSPPSGYGGIYIGYEPCYRVSVRLTEGDGASVVEAAGRLGFDDLVPFIRLCRSSSPSRSWSEPNEP